VLLARHRDTLLMIQEGLSVANIIRADSGQLIGLYFFASKCHMSSGKLLAALDYQKEALKLSLELDNPWAVSRQYAHLGLVYNKLGDHSEAIRLIHLSGEFGKRLRDEKMSRAAIALLPFFLDGCSIHSR
jgi:tetratricopeptide (TPR) repeat protein